MMSSPWPLLLLALSAALAAPSAPYQDYPEVIVVQKRAALVLDRLLIALQKALHEDSSPETRLEKPDRDGPRTAPLRVPNFDVNDMMADDASWAEGWQSELRDADPPRPAAPRLGVLEENTSSLQRRGQSGARGRVLRCYFNAVTCF